MAIQDQVQSIYDKIFQNAREQNDATFAPQRSQLIAEEAANGRLRDPQSILSLSRFDTQKNNALSNIFGNLLQGQAGSEVQNDQFGRSLDFSGRQLNESARQFDAGNALKARQLQILKDQADDERNGIGATLGNISKGVGIAKDLVGAGKAGGLFF